MQRTSVLLLFVAAVGLAACNGGAPTEMRDQGTDFPVTANWSSTAAPVSPATVSGTLAIAQRLGYHLDASFTITGAPNATYQWRIFRGDCTVNIAGATSTSATGLVIFSTLQAYPNIVVGASGTGVAAPTLAGSLDSLTAYSVRVRLSQTSTNWNGTNPIACGDLQRTPAS